MFGLPKKNEPSPVAPAQVSLRDTLFGDMPWESLAKPNDAEPWRSFYEARMNHESDPAATITALEHILEMPDLESRCYLQAWHFLRQLGTSPAADQAKKVLGVVIEVGMPQGVDLLAAYADGSARYWNYSGAGVVWDAKGDRAIDSSVQELLRRAKTVAENSGPWLEPRRPAPAPSIGRLNILTPSGLHFGEAPMAVLSKDPIASGVLNVGIVLMRQLIEKGEQARGKPKPPAGGGHKK